MKKRMNHYLFQSNMFSTFHISSSQSHATHFAYHFYSRIDGVYFNEFQYFNLFRMFVVSELSSFLR